MIPQQTSRQAIRQYLTAHGGILEDPAGMAAVKLREELELPASAKHVLSDMERAGEVRREVRGRRTFRIELVEPVRVKATKKTTGAGTKRVTKQEKRAPRRSEELIDTLEPTAEVSTSVAGLNLAELADALLAIVVKRATGPGTGSVELADRLRQAQELQVATEVHLAEIVAERDAARGQVRELEARLDLADRNLRRATQQRPTPPVKARPSSTVNLNEEERALLDQLLCT